MATPQATAEHYRSQQRLTVATLGLTRAAWARMGEDFDSSWRRVRPLLTVVVARAQLGAATAGAGYVGPTLEELGTPVAPDAEVIPSAFAGVASDGRPLTGLLDGAVVTAKEAVASGAAAREALAIGGRWLDMAVHTQVADAARGAAGVAITVRPTVGFVRMLNPPSCSRCAILAGKRFYKNAGFQRHPRCFPAGVVVSGPAADAATRRWYEGELVVLATASGQELPLTGNHPVLTSQGWVPAHLVHEGDDVVRSTRTQGATPLIVPDHHQMPARIEDLWRPASMTTLHGVPTAAEDFHGDGGYGDVDVVFADGFLRNGHQSSLRQPLTEHALANGLRPPPRLLAGGAGTEEFVGLADTSYSLVRGSGLRTSLGGRHLRGADLPGFGPAPNIDALVSQSFADNQAGHAVTEAETVLALASQVGGRDLLDWELDVPSRWDAPALPLTEETRSGYAGRGQDLRLRLTGQVELDRVVKVERVGWSGHVYNLSSVEGWYSANGLIVSNCDCRHVPCTEDMADDLRTDPKAYFDSLDETEQNRIFTNAGAQAIRDGADMGRVVNARRGMNTAAGPSGRARLVRDKRGDFKVGSRLMPESIYERAETREQAVDLLRKNGFLR